MSRSSARPTHAAEQGNQQSDDTATDHHESEKSERLAAELFVGIGDLVENRREVVIDFDVHTEADQSDANDDEQDIEEEQDTSQKLDTTRKLLGHCEGANEKKAEVKTNVAVRASYMLYTAKKRSPTIRIAERERERRRCLLTQRHLHGRHQRPLRLKRKTARDKSDSPPSLSKRTENNDVFLPLLRCPKFILRLSDTGSISESHAGHG